MHIVTILRDIVTTSWSADHIGFLLLNIYLVGPTSWFCVLFYIARSGLLHIYHYIQRDICVVQLSEVKFVENMLKENLR